jgi:hypothetical protein
MLPSTPPLDQISVAQLTWRCADVARNFLRHLPSDERCCFELFHRAIVKGDDAAWSSLKAVS